MSKFRKLVLNILKESIIKCDVLPAGYDPAYININKDKINVLKNPHNEQEIINFLKNNTKTGEARVFDVGPNTYYADANLLTHWHLLDILKYNDIVDEQAVYKNNGEIALCDFENTNEDLSILNLPDLYHAYIILHNNPGEEDSITSDETIEFLHYIYSDEDIINKNPDDYDTFVNKYKQLLNDAKKAYDSAVKTHFNNMTSEIEKLCQFYYTYIILAKKKHNKLNSERLKTGLTLF